MDSLVHELQVHELLSLPRHLERLQMGPPKEDQGNRISSLLLLIGFVLFLLFKFIWRFNFIRCLIILEGSTGTPSPSLMGIAKHF